MKQSKQTTTEKKLLSPIQPQLLLQWQWQGWSCQRCVWSWVCLLARWSTSWLWGPTPTRHSPYGRCCRRPFQTAAGSCVIALQGQIQRVSFIISSWNSWIQVRYISVNSLDTTYKLDVFDFLRMATGIAASHWNHQNYIYTDIEFM